MGFKSQTLTAYKAANGKLYDTEDKANAASNFAECYAQYPLLDLETMATVDLKSMLLWLDVMKYEVKDFIEST